MNSRLLLLACLVLSILLAMPKTARAADDDDEEDGSEVTEEACEVSDKLELVDLQCVKCGIQKATGQKPSEKWLMLIGATNQEYIEGLEFGSSKIKTVDDQKLTLARFHRFVAEKIQAYGFCLEEETDSTGASSSRRTGYGAKFEADIGTKNARNAMITGSKSTTADERDKIAQAFGLDGALEMKRIFDNTKAWSFIPIKERQKNFDELEIQYARNGFFDRSLTRAGSQLEQCIAQIKTQRKQKDFAKAGQTANINLCQSIAMTCGLNDVEFCSTHTHADEPITPPRRRGEPPPRPPADIPNGRRHAPGFDGTH